MARADFLAKVKTETRDQHERLETLLPLMDPALSMGDYQKLLAKFWGLVEPIEAILSGAELPPEVEFDKRKRSQLLVQDLEALGRSLHEIKALPRCERVPSMGTCASSLGVMYVTEGSTLGGQFISRMLRDRFGITPDRGGAFFSSYGTDVSLMWRKFCNVASENVVGAEAEQEFLTAAQQTFSSFENWLSIR